MTLPRVATAIRVRGGQGTPAQLPAVSPVQGQHVVFEFDAVFDEAASQLDVYREVCEPLANAFVQGSSCSVLTYGASSTGKTHTLEGRPEAEQAGLIQRSLHTAFSTALDAVPRERFRVLATYSALSAGHDPLLHDLLAPAGTPGASFKDVATPLAVDGLTQQALERPEDVVQVLQQGRDRLALLAAAAPSAPGASTTSPTRSPRHAAPQPLHTLLSIYLVGSTASGRHLMSRLSFVELAAPEPKDALGHSRSSDPALARSLYRAYVALTGVVVALKAGAQGGSSPAHIPWRDAPLTRWLKDVLLGSTTLLALGTVSPAPDAAVHSLSTLTFVSKLRSGAPGTGVMVAPTWDTPAGLLQQHQQPQLAGTGLAPASPRVAASSPMAAPVAAAATNSSRSPFRLKATSSGAAAGVSQQAAARSQASEPASGVQPALKAAAAAQPARPSRVEASTSTPVPTNLQPSAHSMPAVGNPSPPRSPAASPSRQARSPARDEVPVRTGGGYYSSPSSKTLRFSSTTRPSLLARAAIEETAAATAEAEQLRAKLQAEEAQHAASCSAHEQNDKRLRAEIEQLMQQLQELSKEHHGALKQNIDLSNDMHARLHALSEQADAVGKEREAERLQLEAARQAAEQEKEARKRAEAQADLLRATVQASEQLELNSRKALGKAQGRIAELSKLLSVARSEKAALHDDKAALANEIAALTAQNAALAARLEATSTAKAVAKADAAAAVAQQETLRAELGAARAEAAQAAAAMEAARKGEAAAKAEALARHQEFQIVEGAIQQLQHMLNAALPEAWQQAAGHASEASAAGGSSMSATMLASLKAIGGAATAAAAQLRQLSTQHLHVKQRAKMLESQLPELQQMVQDHGAAAEEAARMLHEQAEHQQALQKQLQQSHKTIKQLQLQISTGHMLREAVPPRARPAASSMGHVFPGDEAKNWPAKTAPATPPHSSPTKSPRKLEAAPPQSLSQSLRAFEFAAYERNRWQQAADHLALELGGAAAQQQPASSDSDDLDHSDNDLVRAAYGDEPSPHALQLRMLSS